MFRFKDRDGLGHVLADEEELRAAIADGRVHPSTPFTEGDGSWTLARLHPAYRAAAATAGGGAFDWSAFARAATTRLGMVALVSVATFIEEPGEAEELTRLSDG